MSGERDGRADDARIAWVGALLCRDGRVLLGLRAAHKRLAPGRWDMLGGHVEAGETPLRALWRELHEETGIAPPARGPDAGELGDFAFAAGVLRIYRVDAWTGEPRLLGSEHQRLQWFEPAHAAALPDLADPHLRGLLLGLG